MMCDVLLSMFAFCKLETAFNQKRHHLLSYDARYNSSPTKKNSVIKSPSCNFKPI